MDIEKETEQLINSFNKELLGLDSPFFIGDLVVATTSNEEDNDFDDWFHTKLLNGKKGEIIGVTLENNKFEAYINFEEEVYNELDDLVTVELALKIGKTDEYNRLNFISTKVKTPTCFTLSSKELKVTQRKNEQFEFEF